MRSYILIAISVLGTGFVSQNAEAGRVCLAGLVPPCRDYNEPLPDPGAFPTLDLNKAGPPKEQPEQNATVANPPPTAPIAPLKDDGHEAVFLPATSTKTVQ